MNANVGTVLAIVGALTMCVGSLWLLGLAFKKSILWGLCSLFIPLVIWIFVILNLKDAWRPVAALLLGALAFGLGWSMMPHPQ